MKDYPKRHQWISGKSGGDSLFGLPIAPEKPKRNSRINLSSKNLANLTIEKAFTFSAPDAARELLNTKERQWINRGEKRVLELFHAAAKHVPAYRKFLDEYDIRPSSIRSMNEFKKLPLIDKENYLRAYPLEELCWYGDLSSNHMISVSSGSSGQPFFWPRGQILDTETSLEHELFLSSFFELDKKSTLFVVCFAMGMYVAGPITLSSVVRMSEKGYPVTVVTPGYSPDDVLNVIPSLAPKYDQVVLAGYPPYIKEIIDQGIDRGIDWASINLRFLLAGEGFNESWRTYVAELAGKKSPVLDFLNLYGSADAAVLAHETQASIVVRRRIANDIHAREKLFKSERLPSFLQFHPEHKFFETINDELIFTATGGIPLVRYNIHDRGGVLTKSDILAVLPDLSETFDQLEADHKMWHLPFVYVFGKSDQTIILYGANVYPENIRNALEQEEIRGLCSGKMIMYTADDENRDQRFHIDIECSKVVQKDKKLEEKISEIVLNTLLRENSEYKVVHQGIGERTVPIVHLHSHGEEKFRSVKVKHTWSKKD